MKINDGDKIREIPYGPWKYKRIVEECYVISHRINTSYTDLLKISPLERKYILEWVTRELNTEQEAAKKLKQKSQERENKK